jgi:hypothetical protein
MHTLTYLSMQRVGSWRSPNRAAATREQDRLRRSQDRDNDGGIPKRHGFEQGYGFEQGLRPVNWRDPNKPNFQASPLDLYALQLLWCGGENAMRVAQRSGSETAGRASAPGERTDSDLMLTMSGTTLAEPAGYASA